MARIDTGCVNRAIFRCVLGLMGAGLIAACDGRGAPEAGAQTLDQSGQQRATVPGQPVDRVAAGRKAFRACAACHTVERDGRHRVGPNLWGIYGARAGARDGFSYSSTMRKSDVIWDDAALDGYIANPRKFMPNNRMAFSGEKNADKRSEMIEYLKTLR